MSKPTINRNTVIDALAVLGVEDAVSVHIDSHRVEAVVLARNEQGHRYLIPDQAGRYDDSAEFARDLVQLAIVDDDKAIMEGS